LRGRSKAAVVDAVVVIVITTSVGAEPGNTGFGANEQLVFAGRPEQVKDNAVSVSGLGVIVMC
jgi:ribosomal protein L5